MAAKAAVMFSLALKPSTSFKPAAAEGLPPLTRTPGFIILASSGKKIKTDKPYGIGGGLNLKDGVDASGRKITGKGVYQFTNKYGANVDGYSPIYNPDEWSPSGDVYVGGDSTLDSTTGLAIWAITLAGLLALGALLVYNTSALAQ